MCHLFTSPILPGASGLSATLLPGKGQLSLSLLKTLGASDLVGALCLNRFPKFKNCMVAGHTLDAPFSGSRGIW